MTYDFDVKLDRKGSSCVKHDLLNPVFGRSDVLPMWVADMDFETPDFIREAVMERAAHPVYGYTFRDSGFYESIAGWLSRRHGWEVNPNSIAFSPGVVPALNLCVLAFTEPGERILVQPPVYFPFFSAIEGHGRRLIHNQLLECEGRYSIDFTDLEDQFKEGVKMFILCSPHNPAGRVWTREELSRIAELCLQYGVILLSDEIHADLVLFGHRHIPVASLDEDIAAQTITCIAPSKTFNLAGLHSSALVIRNAEWKKKYEAQLDLIHVGGGNLFGQVAMQAAYTHGDSWLDQLLAYLEKNYRIMADYLSLHQPDVVLTPLEATYLAWMDLGYLGLPEEDLRRFIIEKAHLGLNDGSMFGPGGSGHQRINLACPSSVIKEALGRLDAALREAG